MSLKSLKEKKQSATINIQLEGKNQIKTESLLGKTVTIRNVDLMKTKNGECGVMEFDEYPNSFYFAGNVLTDLVRDVITDGAVEELKKDGLKISIFKAKSEKTNREYVTYRFV